MAKRDNQSIPHISQEEYTREYYEECCHGYDEFHASHGEILPNRLIMPIELAHIESGIRVIDLGCGRGETVMNCALRGAWVWGLDYSRNALKLSKEVIDLIVERDVRERIALQQANVTHLPFPTDCVDVVFMLDIVEHLNTAELKRSFADVYRILQPGGRLIVHTMPNLWYYRFGYPLFRLFEIMRGSHLPKNPRSRWAYSHVHVNEQTILSLKKSLASAGFNARVWLSSTQSYEYEKNPIVRFIMRFITWAYPFRLIFCNDIFAVAIKI